MEDYKKLLVPAIAVGIACGALFGYKNRHKLSYSKEEWDLRVKLACAYRVAAKNGWEDCIYNHITVRIPGPEGHFLINPFGLKFSEVTASGLVKVQADGSIVDPGSQTGKVNKAGFVIHSCVHEKRHDIGAVFHHHTPSGKVCATVKCGMLKISQDISVLWHKLSSKVHKFEGLATDKDEQERILDALGDKFIVMLSNHGVLIGGRNIEDAYFNTYMMDRACTTQMNLLQAAGGDLSKLTLVDDEVITKTEERMTFDNFKNWGSLEFQAEMREIDRINPGYAR